MIRIRKIILVVLLSTSMAACSAGLEVVIAEIGSQPASGVDTSDHANLESSNVGVTEIYLNEDEIMFEGKGVWVDGSLATITAAGSYFITGTLNDGQIAVDAPNTDVVELILNGVDITNNDGAPFYVRNAKETVIILADGTENTVTDGKTYDDASVQAGEPDAAIFSNDDLTIQGSGVLRVNANHRNGIGSDDDLAILGGTIMVQAVNDGIKGRDSVTVTGGVIQITAEGDGLESNNDAEEDKGVITIQGGNMSIDAGKDGIHAETRLLVTGGDIHILTGGGSAEAPARQDWGAQRMLTTPMDGARANIPMGTPPADGQPPDARMRPSENVPPAFQDGTAQTSDEENVVESTKGMKAGVEISISGGIIQIDALDDAIHSNDRLTISGGQLSLASGDDGMHADTSLIIEDGSITISQAYEGLESSTLAIRGGNIHIVASDDGINTAGGRDGSSMNGWPGRDEFSLSGDYNLEISGGYIHIDANGDGIDANGNIEMTGGTVIINGPTSNNNGAIDYLGSFNISGGLLVAAGSSGMAMAPSDTSTQYAVLHNFQSVQKADSLVHVESQEGQEILTFQPVKDYLSLLISSPELANGTTYVIFSGGSADGISEDGICSACIYSPGSIATSFTIVGMVTESGQRGGFPAGPGGGGGGRGQPGN